ncbi:MAG: DNA replication protein [Proteobacteria bacterium]|nr:DNA replication protein [Pseudomonadota bacterium]
MSSSEQSPRAPGQTPPARGQLPLALGHRMARGREDFLVAPSNQDAVHWIDRWSTWPRGILAVHGPAGCGKTHLAEVWRAASDARTIAAEAIGAALQAGDLPEHVVVEDGDRGVDEEALLHLYNSIVETRGFLLLTGRTAPARWSVALPDLRSRLRAAQSVGIGPPDDDLFGAVLIKLFDERQLRVRQEVVLYLLARLERSFAAARGCVAVLDDYSLAAGRNITVPLVREALDAAAVERLAMAGEET